MVELLTLLQEGEWLLGFGTSLLIALTMAVSCIGFGSQFLQHKEWDYCFGVGLVVLGTVLLPLTALGLLSFSLLLCPVGLYLLWRNHWEIVWFRRDSWFVVWTVLFGILQLNILLPQIDTDALYYHLAVPKQIWLQNQLLGGELKPNASRPLPFHLVLSLIFGMGGFQAMLSFCSLIGLGAMLSLGERIRGSSRWFVLLLCLGSYSFLEQVTVVANNLVVGFLLYLAWSVSRDKRGQIGILGILLAGAIAIKFTAVGVGFSIWLMAERTWKERSLEAGIGSVIIIIWWIRNILEGNHFLFPYSGWEIDIPFLYVEKYGLGRDLGAMLLLPWNIVMRAKIDSFQFLGQLSPLFLFSPVLLWHWIRNRAWKEAFIVLFGFAFWAMGPHWIRHLFPLFFLFVFLLAKAVPWNRLWFRIIACGLFALGLSGNLGPFVQKKIELTEKQEQMIAGYRAVQWLNQHSGEDEKVALFFSWAGAELDRPFVLGSVEDHTPIRHWFLIHGDESIVKLRNQEVKYIVVGPHRFLASAYPFLEKEAFEKQFIEPVRLMEEALLRDTRLVVQFEGYSVYKINP